MVNLEKKQSASTSSSEQSDPVLPMTVAKANWKDKDDEEYAQIISIR